MSEYARLYDAARKIGLWVELHAGKIIVPGPQTRRRSIIGLVLVHESGRIIAEREVRGIGDRDRAAAELLPYVEGPPA